MCKVHRSMGGKLPLPMPHAAQKDGGGQQHAGRDADRSCHVYAYHVPLVSHKVVKR